MSIVVGILIALGIIVLGLLMVTDPGDWLVQNMKLPRGATIAVGVLVIIGGVMFGLASTLGWI